MSAIYRQIVALPLPQGVLVKNGILVEALGAGGADITFAQGFEHTGADVARLDGDSAERKDRGRQGDVPDSVEPQRGQIRGKTAFYFGHLSPQMVNKTYARAVPQADVKRFFGGVKKRPAFCLGALVYLNSSKSSAEGRWVAGLSRYEVTGIVMRPV